MILLVLLLSTITRRKRICSPIYPYHNQPQQQLLLVDAFTTTTTARVRVRSNQKHNNHRFGMTKEESNISNYPKSADLSIIIDDYSKYWDTILREEYDEMKQQDIIRQSTWSFSKLQQYGFLIPQVLVEPESQLVGGEKTVRISIDNKRRRSSLSWEDLYTKGDILEMSLVEKSTTSSFSIRRKHRDDPLNKRECIIVDVGSNWMILGVGKTYPFQIWENRRKYQTFVKIVRQVSSTTPYKIQRRALQQIRMAQSTTSPIIPILAHSWWLSTTKSPKNDPKKTKVLIESMASRPPSFLLRATTELLSSTNQTATTTNTTTIFYQQCQQALERVVERQQLLENGWVANESQQNAILWALTRQISLIRGPPGTGKTRTAALLIATYLQLHEGLPSSPKVLAITHSNGAADVFCDALIQIGIPAVRYGRPASISPSIQHRTTYKLVEQLPHIKTLKKRLLKGDDRFDALTLQYELKKAIEEGQLLVLQSSPVVVTSCIGAYQLTEQIAGNLKFPLVVLDEAAQCTEPSLLTSLVVAGNAVEQLVLVGDSQQLPPTVTSTTKHIRDAIGISPMKRLESIGIQQQTLQIQYRMPPSLLEHPSKYFYNGLVESSSSILEDTLLPPVGFDWPTPTIPLAFVQVGGGETIHSMGGKSNTVEAQKVTQIVANLLLNGDVSYKDIAVLTPYSKQVQTIRTALEKQSMMMAQQTKSNTANITSILFSDEEADNEDIIKETTNTITTTSTTATSSMSSSSSLKNLRNVKVGTIDSFQGQEVDIVLFSSVRSNGLGELGFLRDRRRLNVAITRSRRALIVVGDSTTLKSCKHWSALIESCISRNCFVQDDVETTTSAIVNIDVTTTDDADGATMDTTKSDNSNMHTNLLDRNDSFLGLFTTTNTTDDIASLLS
jgi:hypothetical protein